VHKLVENHLKWFALRIDGTNRIARFEIDDALLKTQMKSNHHTKSVFSMITLIYYATNFS
jgi:hypothetical protein